MQGFSNNFDDLLGILNLIAFSVAMGGVIWGLVVLRAWKLQTALEQEIARRSITLIMAGAAGLAIFQVMHVVLKVALMASILSQPISGFFHTGQFKAGLTQAVIAAAMAVCALWLRRSPNALSRWAAITGFAILLGVSGAWLTHATGLLEDRATFMAWTAIHQMGAAFWVGGVVQLGALWQLTRRREDLQPLWGRMLERFSAVGIASVLLLVVTGSILAWHFVATLQGLVGTAYGSLVIIKVVLLASALALAALNFRAARDWRKQVTIQDVRTKVPYFIEVETVILVVILLVAASLSSQPPAVDVMNQSATWSEVVEAFSPKLPHLISPSSATVSSAREARLVLADSGDAELDWSNFNHNLAGMLLLMTGALAIIARKKPGSWAQHWPLGFALLAAALFFRTDPETWPFGPVGFWEGTFAAAEVLQHRVALIVAFALGIMEWRARKAAKATRMPYFFPILCLAGGSLLLTHSHQVFEIKQAFLTEVSHAWMGLLAVIMACGRWLELRFTPGGQAPALARAGGLVVIVALLLIGLILVSYREVPPTQVQETPLQIQQAVS